MPPRRVGWTQNAARRAEGSPSPVAGICETPTSVFAQSSQESSHLTRATGQWSRTTIGGCLAHIPWLLYEGKDVLGMVAILGALATLVGVFVYARESQKAERREKRLPLEKPAPS